MPCYGALFGPQLFGHGTRVESHTSFGKKESPKLGNKPILPRSTLESKIKVGFLRNMYKPVSGNIVNDLRFIISSMKGKAEKSDLGKLMVDLYWKVHYAFIGEYRA